jgi:hypothetical protein
MSRSTLITAWLLAVFPSVSSAAQYALTEIVASSQLGGALPTCYPAINNSSVVAFRFHNPQLGYAIYKSSAGTLTPVVDVSNSWYIPSIFVDINDAGVVAFTGQQDGTFGIYKGAGAVITTIAEGVGPFMPGANPNYGNPSISDTGEVIFHARNDSTFNAGEDEAGLFIGNGGGLTTLEYVPQDLRVILDPTISSDGQFLAYLWRQPGSNNWGFYRHEVAQANPKSLLTEHQAPRVYDAAVNNAGDVVWTNGDGLVGRSISLSIGGEAATLFAHSVGEFQHFPSVAMNNVGEVAFWAVGDTFEGIYTGPDRVLNKIVETGDPLAGSTIAVIGFGRAGLNDKGQITFWARLADGREGIYTATRIPEPCSAILMILAMLVTSAFGRRPRKQGRF